MLASLKIKNYVLIDSLEVSFPEGLVIITGQTGAGKSILIGALGLALGAKADTNAIAEGADSCVVEAEFTQPNPALKTIFEEEDAEWDSDSLIVRRVLSRSGRSRCFVNDCPASATFLSRIAGSLIDIHSQHQNLLLSDKKFQLSLLDYFAGDADLLAEVADLYGRHKDLCSQITSLEQRIASADEQRDYNQSILDRLTAAALKEGELEQLQEEEKRLANAEHIKEALCGALSALGAAVGYGESASAYGSGSPSGSDSLDTRLRTAGRELDRLVKYFPEFASLAERLESARIELDDILSELDRTNDAFDADGSRLEAVQERVSLLQGLLAKHHCATISELITLRDSLSALLSDDGALQIELTALRKQEARLASELIEAAERLHQARVKAAEPLSQTMTESIRSLELPYAVFTVQVAQRSEITATGKDDVAFLFSANGQAPVEVAKCASGGEVSRIMLCLKDRMARYTAMPAMIFDEIDSGVSGSVADKMGSMICSMGERMQVFAITHLPQVAAKGQAHYLVSKDFDPDTRKAVSNLQRLSDEERVLELARMLSGSTLTGEAIANAKALLR
ncbi:MAG: DNA repair protein RecN [Bacteroidales bacterium]|nr:DNA repair protein RecN [Bacteroidales bacterium]